jgi:hypothetical protein
MGVRMRLAGVIVMSVQARSVHAMLVVGDDIRSLLAKLGSCYMTRKTRSPSNQGWIRGGMMRGCEQHVALVQHKQHEQGLCGAFAVVVW